MLAPGTIVRNMYQPSYKSYFVYRYTEKGEAHGLSYIATNLGEESFRWDITFDKKAVEKDREHFPIVGHINLEQLIKNHLLNEVSRYTQRLSE